MISEQETALLNIFNSLGISQEDLTKCLAQPEVFKKYLIRAVNNCAREIRLASRPVKDKPTKASAVDSAPNCPNGLDYGECCCDPSTCSFFRLGRGF